MNTWLVGCADAWAPEIRERIVAAAPPGFEVEFASPADPAAWHGLLARSDFLLLAANRMTAEMLEGAGRLRLIHKWGIGYDDVDLPAAEREGVGVAITAGANAHAVAEHTIMLMLATLRRLSVVDRALREGRWLFKEMRVQCLQMSGRTVGLVGFGNIGRAVAKRLAGFETTVLYYDPRPASQEVEQALGATLVPFDTLLQRADIVSLHCPGGTENRHMMGQVQFGRMKRGAVLVNAARGELVDQAALTQALTDGTLMGAGLDVFEQEPPSADNPLLQLQNVTLSPHTAASVLDNVGRVANHVFANMQRVANGEALPDADVVVAPRRR
jgi:phosphoglycerate dehydrogenase-like enzyme